MRVCLYYTARFTYLHPMSAETFAMSTVTEIQLSPALRAAQRALSAWLEHSGSDARQAAFGARAALATLDRTDHGRLTRWLAWICIASAGREGLAPERRIQRLDAALGNAISVEIERLRTLLPQPFAAHVLRSA